MATPHGDLTDIRNQLLAVSDWLSQLEQRLKVDHHGLCTKEVGQALARVAQAHQRVSEVVAEVCKNAAS